MADPLEEYNRIICTRQRNPLTKGGELHHIIPRACGGSDKEWNLVRLTCEEHYKVHELLPFIYTHGVEHRSMVFAWHMMKCVKGAETDSKKFSELKAEMCRQMGELRKGKSSGMLGKKHSAEARAKMSLSHKGQRLGMRHSEEAKRKMSLAKKGKPHPGWTRGQKLSDEHRKHISAGLLGNTNKRGKPMSEEQKAKIRATFARKRLERKEA